MPESQGQPGPEPKKHDEPQHRGRRLHLNSARWFVSSAYRRGLIRQGEVFVSLCYTWIQSAYKASVSVSGFCRWPALLPLCAARCLSHLEGYHRPDVDADSADAHVRAVTAAGAFSFLFFFVFSPPSFYQITGFIFGSPPGEDFYYFHFRCVSTCWYFPLLYLASEWFPFAYMWSTLFCNSAAESWMNWADKHADGQVLMQSHDYDRAWRPRL